MMFAIHRVECQNNEAYAYCLTAQRSSFEITHRPWNHEVDDSPLH